MNSAAGEKPPSFWDRIVLVLQEEALSLTLWLSVGVGGGIALVALKIWQKRLFDPSLPLGKAIDQGFFDRVNDPSFVCLVLGVIVGFALSFPAVELRLGGRLGDAIPFSRRAAFWLLIAIVAMWTLYLQAVFRDGGTFFWTIGDGKPYVRLAFLPPDMSPSALGPIFGGKSWDQLSPVEQATCNNGARNHEWLALVQGVEGVIFLFALGIWAFVGIVINIYVQLLGRLTALSRGTSLGRATWQLFLISIFPTLGMIGMSIITVDWKTGIASIILAWLTSIAIWLPLGVAACRILKDDRFVLSWGKAGIEAAPKQD